MYVGCVVSQHVQINSYHAHLIDLFFAFTYQASNRNCNNKIANKCPLILSDVPEGTISTSLNTEEVASRILVYQQTEGDSDLDPLLNKKPQNSPALLKGKSLVPLSHLALFYETTSHNRATGEPK
jgi:hypothetical protein